MATINGTVNDDVLVGTDDADTINGDGGKDTLDGGKGDDLLDGGADDDTLHGSDGNDRLDGGTGNDIMDGGLGDDLFIVDSVDDHVSDTSALGGGRDTVQASVTFSLSNGGSSIETLILTGTAAIDGTGNGNNNILIGNSAANTLYGLAGVDRLDGGAGADTMIGGADGDTYVVDDIGDQVIETFQAGILDTVEAWINYVLPTNVERLILMGSAALNGTGNAASNHLIGNDAANILDSGGGADELTGKGGDDRYIVSNSSANVYELDGEGNDTVESSATFSLVGQFIEALTLTGGAAINATGNGLANMIIGNAAANRIDGGASADTMRGGGGDDRYIVSDGGDLAVEIDGEGYDTVESSITYSIAGQFIEALTLTGAAAVNATGNALANALTGNVAANTLNGGDGNDVLDGAGGADTMIGGLGDDLFYIDQLGDLASEYINGGYDTVRASISYSLAGYYGEALILTGNAAINGTGNSLSNVLTGNSAANTLEGREGNDVIDGGGGIDTMTGGLGDDVFYVGQAGDLAIEANGEGKDTVYAAVNYSLSGQYIENLILTGGAVNGTGNKLANVLTGNNNDNTLNGGEGNDTIDGGAGNDTMIGGLGDDIFFVGQAGDVVSEYNGQGNDSVYASVSFSLAGQFIENLTLTGSGAINGTGNKLANVLTGNAAANVLSGADGDDSLHGGLGADTLTGGLGADGFWFDTALGGGNVDSITDFDLAADTICLDRSVFAGLAADGVLDSGAFAYGTSAQDADDRILYDAATGSLYYDADGAGGAAAVLFAQITAGTALTSGDFFAYP